MRIISFGAAILSISLFACKKIKTGVKTEINGFVVDTVKNKRLSNATVEIMGTNVNFEHGKLYRHIDTVLTDSNGEFSYTITSDGKFSGYAVAVLESENFTQGYRYDITPSTQNKMRLRARELSYIKAQIAVGNSPFDSLEFFIRYNRYILRGRKIDTTIVGRILPASKNVAFIRGCDKVANRFRQFTDTIVGEMRDTTSYQKVIADFGVL